MLKAVIFDIDGVLVDSKNANVALFQKILKAAGYKEPSRKDVLKYFHLPLRQVLEELTGQSVEEIERIVQFVFDPTLRVSHLYEFPARLEEILEDLHKSYKLAIVTSRIRFGVDEIFSMKKIGHLFDVVVSYEDIKNPKPHPEPLLVALKRLKVKASEAIYIGDSPTDIDSAKAARVKSIFLNTAIHQDATAIIGQFSEIPETVHLLT